MATLEYNITGTVSGLSSAASAATGILRNLQQTADNLKINLLGATTKDSIDAIGGALTIITGKIKEYTASAIQGSQAFKDQQTTSILDSLNIKITTLNGSAQLFGSTIKTQQAEINAYTSAINKLLSNGLNPLDSKVVSIKSKIDSLTDSIKRQNDESKQAKFVQQFQATGSLIDDAQSKVSRLGAALRGATDERSIVKYNLRLIEAEKELDRLRGLGIRAAQGTGAITQSANKLSGSFNSVGIEFGRIIQDAPFAANNFGAVGNNITRLVEILPGYIAQTRAAIIAQGGVATSANVAKTALGGLFTGFGGISLAISALVAGYVIYQQIQQSSKRKQEELNGVSVDYIDTLHGIEKAQLQGAKNAEDDLTKLRLLYAAYQNANLPLAERKVAYEQLQQLYPQYFGNITFEQKAGKDTTKVYNDLTTSILASSKARAAANIITANSERALQNENKQKKIDIELIKERAKLSALSAKGGTTLAGIGGAGSITTDTKLRANQEQVINDLLKLRADLTTDTTKLYNENVGLEKDVNAEFKKGGTLIDLNNGKKEKGNSIAQSELSLYQQLQNILQKGLNSAANSGLTGLSADIAKINTQYDELNRQLDQFNAKVALQAKSGKITEGKADMLTGLANGGKGSTEQQRQKEINDARLAEVTRVAGEIDRINGAFGVKSEESKAKERASIEVLYDKEKRAAEGNQAILIGLEEGKLAAIQAINDKYYAIEQDLRSKIALLEDESTSAGGRKLEKQSDKITLEFAKRRKAANDLFEALKKVSGANIGAITVAQNNANDKFNQDETNAQTRLKNAPIEDALKQVTSGFIRDLSDGLFNASSKAGADFKSVFSGITTSLASTIQNVVVNNLSKALTDGIDIGLKGMSAKLQAIIGGLAIAGGLVSGLTPKTSAVGQGIGGALSGAATGAVLGSAVPVIGTVAGAVVGGIVGLVGGIFSASKAQKELEQKQLDEQKRQTELLRANLAYTSSIIGRMTANGVITNIEVGAKGQLVATVSGSDIQFVLDRNSKAR